MPSNIPSSPLGIPTAAEDASTQPKPRYVVSSSGHAAHPEDILASCRALQAHVTKLQKEAEKELRDFEQRISDRELAEKRRVAPGWLDSESRLLEPERQGASAEGQPDSSSMNLLDQDTRSPGPADMDEGAQLDRAFVGMALK